MFQYGARSFGQTGGVVVLSKLQVIVRRIAEPLVECGPVFAERDRLLEEHAEIEGIRGEFPVGDFRPQVLRGPQAKDGRRGREHEEVGIPAEAFLEGRGDPEGARVS